MKPSTFAGRLAFARWLAYLRTGDLPGNAEIALAAGRTGPWVTKWAASDTPPRDFEVHAPIADYLGVDERWLFRGEGEPPEADLWETWEQHAPQRAAAFRARQKVAEPGAGGLAIEGYAPTGAITRASAISPAEDRRPSHVRAAEKFGGKVAEGSPTPLAQKHQKPRNAAASGRRRKS